jgi:hypothetical protein
MFKGFCGLRVPSSVQREEVEMLYFGLCLKSRCRGGFQAWSKERGLGPRGEGLRGFKSHPPHFSLDPTDTATPFVVVIHVFLRFSSTQKIGLVDASSDITLLSVLEFLNCLF